MSLRQLLSASRVACTHSNPSPGRLLPILRTTSQFLCQTFAHANDNPAHYAGYGTAIKIKFPWVNNSPPIPTSGQQWFFQLLFNCPSVKLQDLQACTILRKKSSAFIKNTFMALNLSRYSFSCIILCLRSRKVLQRNTWWQKELAILLCSPCVGSKRFRQETACTRKRPDSLGKVLAQEVHSTEW